ncbi:hypothetical protein HY844_00820 [Candidatus Berkelbacteria bacterium]|nr:hypothetical protein [Candidatus Berkelbacteria bacterium]
MNIATKTLPEIKKRVISGISSSGNEYAVYSTALYFNETDYNFNIVTSPKPFEISANEDRFCAALGIGTVSSNAIQLCADQLLALSSRSSAAIYCKNAKVGKINELKAIGEFEIGSAKVSWTGSSLNCPKNSGVIYSKDKIITNNGAINHRSSTVSFNDSEVGIGLVKFGHKILVNEINFSGSIGLLHNDYVLISNVQLGWKIKCGDIISNWKVGGLQPSDAAIISGGCVISKSLSDTVINYRKYSIQNNEQYSKAENVQRAWSVVIKTAGGEMVLLSLTANSQIMLQRGITIIDLQRYIRSHFQVDWAICFARHTKLLFNARKFANKSLTKPGPEQALYSSNMNSYLCVTEK